MVLNLAKSFSWTLKIYYQWTGLQKNQVAQDQNLQVVLGEGQEDQEVNSKVVDLEETLVGNQEEISEEIDQEVTLAGTDPVGQLNPFKRNDKV